MSYALSVVPIFDDIRQGGEVLTHTHVRFNYRSILLSSLSSVVLRVTPCYESFGSARIRFKDFDCYNSYCNN